jgi:hypothetical protein
MSDDSDSDSDSSLNISSDSDSDSIPSTPPRLHRTSTLSTPPRLLRTSIPSRPPRPPRRSGASQNSLQGIAMSSNGSLSSQVVNDSLISMLNSIDDYRTEDIANILGAFGLGNDFSITYPDAESIRTMIEDVSVDSFPNKYAFINFLEKNSDEINKYIEDPSRWIEEHSIVGGKRRKSKKSKSKKSKSKKSKSKKSKSKKSKSKKSKSKKSK